MSECLHQNIRCINQYELIRKYECSDCDAIMMCTCNESIGRSFLPHQLLFGTELETQKKARVTHGFVANICQECRGLPGEPHPVASIPGCTSKIKRYYWRELAFREMELYVEYGGTPAQYLYEIDRSEKGSLINKARKQALSDIKLLHQEREKYSYQEASTADIIEKYNVHVDNVSAIYVEDNDRRAKILCGENLVTVEDYARHVFEEQEFRVLFLESVPFHVLFAVYMWIVIQDPTDNRVRMVGFGERSAYEEICEKNPIWVPLPDDFGTPGYAERRVEKIERHFFAEMEDKENMLRLFDYWIPYSKGLRQYLWAHREKDLEKARTVVEVLPAHVIISILKYLVSDYWGRYLGWPDLLVYKESGYFFVEVKSSKDKFSEDQKRWVSDNHEYLKLPFKILKIHRRVK